MTRAFLFVVLGALTAAFTAPLPAAGAQEGVVAKVTIGKSAREIRLIRRQGDTLVYAMPDAPRGVTATLSAGAIKEAEFQLTFDEARIFEARRRRQWVTASQMLLTPLKPAIPFLFLPENNAVAPAEEAGHCLMKAAANYRRAGQKGKEKADAALNEARRLFQAVSMAEWYSGAAEAELLAIQCLTLLGKADEAAEELSKTLIPSVKDAHCGLYWLTRARLARAQGDHREALDAAMKSLVFESKDYRVFPEALRLSAASYEKLGEVYRARDVYYELARLFADTEYEAPARRRLQAIMESGATKDPEPATVVRVFFSDEEDMNARVAELLSPGETKE